LNADFTSEDCRQHEASKIGSHFYFGIERRHMARLPKRTMKGAINFRAVEERPTRLIPLSGIPGVTFRMDALI
jgi:hypothetical protein